MFIQHMKIGARLGAGFSVVLAILLVVTALGLLKLHRIADLQHDVTDRAHSVDLAEQWAGLTGVNLARTLAIAKSAGNKEVDAFMQPLMKQTTAQISDLQKQLDAAADDARSKELMQDVGSRRKAYIDARNHVFDMLKGGDVQGALAATDDTLRPAAETYLQVIGNYVDYQRQLNASADERADGMVHSAVMWSVTLALCAVVLGAALAWTITASVTRPLNQAVAAAETMATGNLTGTITTDRQDEAGRLLTALAGMQTQLRDIARRIQESALGIRTATVEIASGNQDLSSRTEQSAASLQQTAAAMDQLSGTVRQSSESAVQANDLAAAASDVARKGGELVGHVVTTMEEITTSSQKITEITGLIDSIAFQTNILALNAAVESARAGEHGRGFAVVASEVRTLAQRCASAAKDIKQLINASTQKVEDGNVLIRDTGATMESIVSSVQRVANIIGEISHATAEQSSGLGEINKAINQLDLVTQQNAALVEEAAAAAGALKDQAHRLGEVVEVFRLPANEQTWQSRA